MESTYIIRDEVFTRILKLCYMMSLLFTMVYCNFSCKKFVDVPPPTGTITENSVFKSDMTAISVLTDLYSSMNQSPIQGAGTYGNIGLFAGLAADEYKLNNGISEASYIGYYHNNLSQQLGLPQSGAEHWPYLYNMIFKCNAAIEGLNASNSLSASIKQQLLGEAYFMRAFFYFYLTNMFGDVPIALTTDPEINTMLPRSSENIVYDQIKKDLTEASALLSDIFLDATLLSSTNERVRPTKWAAIALLARVYLYSGDWSNAESQSAQLINNTSLFNLQATLNNVFLKNSEEAIWQIQPTEVSYNTLEARGLVIPPTGPLFGFPENPVRLSTFLLKAFEIGDQRSVYSNWIDTVIYQVSESPLAFDTVPYPFKYKINFSPEVNNADGLSEYFMVFRLAEQYLIRAEARAQLGNLSGAQDDLNVIRIRAGLPNTIAVNQSSLIDAILHERQVELFSEWGHRWFDLKRTGNIDELMAIVTPQKSSGVTQWQSYKQLYPLPLTQLQRAPNCSQNVGY